LLQRLQLDFSCISPGIDETPEPGESAQALVTRLAQAKARKVAGTGPGLLVIGSDQVALLNGNIITKPGTRNAV